MVASKLDITMMESAFIDAGIYMRGVAQGFSILAPLGTAIFRKVQDAVNSRLSAAGYEEVLIPSGCPISTLETLVGASKSELLISTDLTVEGASIGLRPFSEPMAIRPMMDGLGERIFQWSTCFYRERHPNVFLNFRELVKCEIMSLHVSTENALEHFGELNSILNEMALIDMCLRSPTGVRPQYMTFPASERSFVSEVAISNGCRQTLFASHLMTKEIVRLFAPDAPNETRLCSAGFSQKLLATVLLHHRQKNGVWRCPPTIAPWSGIIHPGSPDARQLLYERQPFDAATGLRYLIVDDAASKSKNPFELVWQLAPNLSGDGWLLIAADGPAMMHTSVDGALKAAKDIVSRYASLLRADSEKREFGELLYLDNLRQALPADDTSFAIRLCGDNICESEALSYKRGIPKLLGTGVSDGRCIVCNKVASFTMLFETSESYTSFYVPSAN